MVDKVTKLKEDISLCKQKIRESLDIESEAIYLYVAIFKELKKEFNNLNSDLFIIGNNVQQNTINNEK